VQEFEQLLGDVLRAGVLLLQERFGGGEQCFQLNDLVEVAQRPGRASWSTNACGSVGAAAPT